MVVILPEVIERFAITYSEVGDLVALHQAAYFLCSVIAGIISIKTRPELIISLSTLIGGGLISLLGLVNTYAVLLIVYGILGALIAFAWVPMIRYAALHMDKKQRVLSLGTAACGTAIGFLINGFIIPPIVRYFGYVQLWLTLGLMTIVAGLLSFFTLRGFAKLAAPRNLIDQAPEYSVGLSAKEFPAFSFCFVLFLCGTGLVSFQTYYSSYLVENLNFSDARAMEAWIIPGILGAFSGIFLASVANRFSIKATVLACLATLAAMLLLLSLVQNVHVAKFAGITYGILYFGLFGLFSSLSWRIQFTNRRQVGYSVAPTCIWGLVQLPEALLVARSCITWEASRLFGLLPRQVSLWLS